MGRPKKATTTGGRKALGKKDTNVVAVKAEVREDVEEVEEEERAEDLEEQLRIVNLVCHAVDQEVESRSAAIVAIGDGHMASATTQLKLLISRFPEHIRKMPMKKFLRQHCPNTKVSTRLDGTLFVDLVEEQPPGCGVLNFSTLNFNTGFASVRNTPGFNNVRSTPGFASVQNTPGFGPSQTMKEFIGEGVSNQLAGEKDIEQLSWDEFLAAYRMQSAMKGPSAWETPSLRTPGMSWRDTMLNRNYTPMTEKVYPSMLPSQTGNTLVGGTKRKAPTSRGLRM